MAIENATRLSRVVVCLMAAGTLGGCSSIASNIAADSGPDTATDASPRSTADVAADTVIEARDVMPDRGVPRDDGVPDDSLPMTQVGPCASLGAVGQLENITPPGIAIDTPTWWGITNVVTDPLNAGTVYVGTDRRGIFKSTDCGSTWTKIDTGRYHNVVDGGPVWGLAIDPIQSNILYGGAAYSSDNGLLKSTNGGIDWDPQWPTGSEPNQHIQYNFMGDLSLDPTNRMHIVTTTHGECSAPYASNCATESLDGGATWRLFNGPLSGGFRDGAGPLIIGGNSWLYGTLEEGTFWTGDSGDHWERVGPGNDHSIYHATDGSYYLGSLYGIQHSPDGHTWTPIPNSPNGYGITGDGVHLYTSLRESGPDQQPYFTSLESDPTHWTPFSSPNMTHGAVYFAHDFAHHVIYSANTVSGFYRWRTE